MEPRTGERFSVAEAFERGLVDSTQKDALERAQRAVLGYQDRVSGNTLSLFEVWDVAVICNSTHWNKRDGSL